MALVDEARSVVRSRGPACTVGMYLAALTPEQRTEVDEALANRSVPVAAIVTALDARHANAGWPQPPKVRGAQRP